MGKVRTYRFIDVARQLLQLTAPLLLFLPSLPSSPFHTSSSLPRHLSFSLPHSRPPPSLSLSLSSFPVPLHIYRFILNYFGKIASRIFLFGFGFNWIKTRGQPAPTKEAPVLVVSPHSSMLDMFIISLYKVPTYVARANVRDIPIFGSEPNNNS